MSEIKITIEGEGLSLTKYTTLQKAGQIISFLGAEQSQPTETSSVRSATPVLLGSSRQPKDAISDSGAKTYPQKIAALGKYFKYDLGQDTFSPQDLRNIFKKIGDQPRNFSRDFKDALDQQYINCTDPSADQYELTDRGYDAVQNGFSEQTSRKSSTSRKSTASKGIREEVRALQIVGASIESLPEYHDLPAKADKILWLLQYVDSKNVKGLTSTEVDFLSTELRDRVKINDFAAHNTRNIRKGFVTKTSDGFLIQKKGVDHLKNVGQSK